jgi:hypothetical protein
MATIRSTGSALLGTVSTTANAAVRLVNTVDGAFQYADNWMQGSLHDQRVSIALDRVTSEERMLTKCAQRQTELDMEIESFCSLSEAHRQHYNANLDRFRQALKAI